MEVDLSIRDRVVLVKDLRPASVTDGDGSYGGADDVGEQHRGQDAVGRNPVASAGEKRLNLIGEPIVEEGRDVFAG